MFYNVMAMVVVEEDIGRIGVWGSSFLLFIVGVFSYFDNYCVVLVYISWILVLLMVNIEGLLCVRCLVK